MRREPVANLDDDEPKIEDYADRERRIVLGRLVRVLGMIVCVNHLH